MEQTYIIFSHTHGAWWRPGGAGYTNKLEEAGHYARSEALKLCASARDGWGASPTPPEIPVALDDAQACEALFQKLVG